MALPPEEERKSRPLALSVESDPRERAKLEVENGFRQLDYVNRTIEEALRSEKQFKLRPSLIQTLNRIAVERIAQLPGALRPFEMEITNSRHKPPKAADVPALLEELCDYINENREKSAWHLASYVMWRLNWIHPFEDGNGRTSRAISYLILCVRLGMALPGRKTIPDQIASDKGPYYRALEAADAAFDDGRLDFSEMEKILKAALAAQLYDFHEQVSGK
jgi:Fic family protein